MKDPTVVTEYILLSILTGLMAGWTLHKGIITILRQEFIFTSKVAQLMKDLPAAPRWKGWPGVVMGIVFLTFGIYLLIISFYFFSLAV